MALNAYLIIKGQKQGAIQGPVTDPGRENSILIHSFSHAVVSPRDPVSGLPTGKRQHQPIVILKDTDKSSPLLWTALVGNENLIAWELQFWSQGADAAAQKEIYTIRLTNANIASIQESMNDNELPENANLPLRELISFTYQKIEWIWVDGIVEASDSWEGP